MRHLLIPTLLFLSFSSLFAQADLLGDHQKIRINNNWHFHLGEVEGDPTAVNFDDGNWQMVSVPHAPELVSLEMDSTLNSRPQLEYLRDVSWYRKQVEVPNTPGNRFIIEFEGVHQVTDLYVNGKHVGQYAVGGYTPFHFDVTDFVKPGQQNLIVVKADNSANVHTPPDPHKTDYIKFGGIYRDVYLVVTNPLHITYNYEAFDAGIHITTPSVRNHDATISVKTTVRNENEYSTLARVVTRIIDADGLVVQAMEQRAQVGPGREHTFRQSAVIVFDPDLPRGKRGKRSSALVQSIDVAPTLLARAGVPIPESFQGEDLGKLIYGGKKEVREYLFTENLWSTKFGNPRCESVQNKDWKYIRYYRNNTFSASKLIATAKELGMNENLMLYPVHDPDIAVYRDYVEGPLKGEAPVYEELYHLKKDPTELRNLVADPKHKAILQTLRAAWKQEITRARGEGLPLILRYTADNGAKPG